MIDLQMYQAFADALNALQPGWQLTAEGIAGPHGALVRLVERDHSQARGHVDVQFVLDAEEPANSSLWDCVTGIGATPQARSYFAAHAWSQTTGAAALELKYSRRGAFADHYRGDESHGFNGWHAICGAIIGFGAEDNATTLQRWWLDHPLLPALSEALADSLAEVSAPVGIKILFGGDGLAEVRMDGERHDGACAALAELGWPRLDPPAFVRSYVILVHPETGL